MAQFALSWGRYKQNMCQGLTALQQNGEFVDMTLAADGHHVKVHQMVMSLVSPYIKDLITSAQCPHPIIFLNKTSYATLLSILEYIYTGEVIVEQGNIDELVQAGRELHIKGLEDIKIEVATQNLSQAAFAKSKTDEGRPLSTRGLLRSMESKQDTTNENNDDVLQPKRARKGSTKGKSVYIENQDLSANDDHLNDSTFHNATDSDHETETTMIDIKAQDDIKKIQIPMQYTISNQGGIQMIVNRYLYNLRYTSVRDDGTRRWQCAAARRGSCKATLFTKGGAIVGRCAVHNHPYHDKRILKKVQDNLVYSALNDVEAVANERKNQNKQETENANPSKNKNISVDDTTDAE